MSSFTIDPNNRLIILDQIAPVSGLVTIDVQVVLYSEMKLFWKDDVLAHGLKFPFNTVGGTDYGGGFIQGGDYFLRNDLGWRIRPYEQDHELRINGNLRPWTTSLPTFVPTVGGYSVYAPQERSGVFQIKEIEIGSGLTTEQATQLLEMYKLAGLALGLPMTVTPASRQVDDIDLEITGDGETSTTVERQP